MRVKIILNGGIKSCCSSYSSEEVYEIVKGWLRETDELEAIDITKESWVRDELSSLAEKYFRERIFPIVYVDDVLISMGQIPDGHTLLKIGEAPENYLISKEDILEVARENGLTGE
ncbi:MAG: hypothetical protein ACP5QT_04310 [Brevinematia bacterium]